MRNNKTEYACTTAETVKIINPLNFRKPFRTTLYKDFRNYRLEISIHKVNK